MAKGIQVSTKRIQIDKANSTIVVAVAVAAFLIAFSLVSTKSLLARRSYQSKVSSAQEESLEKLKTNINSVKELKIKYNEFVDRQENMIGGSSTGKGQSDGDNARIILDALPSKYDYPALASSIEKILDDRNYTVKSITGTDDEVQQNNAENLGSTQQAVEMPFSMAAKGSYSGMVDVLKAFRLSIRPIHVQVLVLKAEEGSAVELSVQGKSYFQQQRSLNITEEVIP